MRIISWSWQRLIGWLVLLFAAAACSESSALAPATAPTDPPAPPPGPALDILALPAAFRYEVTLRPTQAEEEAATVITGAYRDGALAQTTRQGDATAEELIVAPDPADGALHSFTRPVGEERWSRWPGVGFDAFYGLASPFSPLRLYPFVTAQNVPAERELLPDVPATAFKAQIVFSPEIIERLLKAGISAVATTPEEREALELQLAPLFLPQTVTYWASKEGIVYQAAATLSSSAADGQAAPWLDVTWRYRDYDDPTIAIAAPEAFEDVAELTLQPAAAPAHQAEPPLAPDTTLRIRVFANRGLLAADAQVMVYPAGKREVLTSQQSADAQFALPAGIYDVFVQAEKAGTWLRGVAVSSEGVSSHDVLFDFGTLTLTVTQGEAKPQVDIVVYPAGQRQEWLDWRTENPATLRLPAGQYDVEIALPDLSATKRVTGIEVEAGQTSEVTVALDKR